MAYTIKQAADKTGLTVHTLRYYDREGLLPLLGRTGSGIRLFSEKDIAWLGLVCCLKKSGMPIVRLREFLNLCLMGEDTAQKRRELLIQHKNYIVAQIEQLKKSLSIVEHKIENYKNIGVFGCGEN